MEILPFFPYDTWANICVLKKKSTKEKNPHDPCRKKGSQLGWPTINICGLILFKIIECAFLKTVFVLVSFIFAFSQDNSLPFKDLCQQV